MRLGEHIVLVAVSTLIAAAIGIPLGILAARRPRAGAAAGRPRQPRADDPQPGALRVSHPAAAHRRHRHAHGAGRADALRRPADRPHDGGRAAGVDRAVLECAVGDGHDARARCLRQVELPLAAPAILAGVRVATVVGVGTATIASAIGAGGLGDYIFRGLAMVDPVVILAGALPAAVLALCADGLLALAARAVDPARGSRAALRVVVAVGRGSLVVLCGADVSRARRRPRSSSARRTSPSRSCSANSWRRRSSADRAERRAPAQSRRHARLRSRPAARRYRRLRRIHRHGADGALQGTADRRDSRSGRRRVGARAGGSPRRYARAASRCCRRSASTTRSRFWSRGDAAREHS